MTYQINESDSAVTHFSSTLSHGYPAYPISKQVTWHYSDGWSIKSIMGSTDGASQMSLTGSDCLFGEKFMRLWLNGYAEETSLHCSKNSVLYVMKDKS